MNIYSNNSSFSPIAIYKRTYQSRKLEIADNFIDIPPCSTSLLVSMPIARSGYGK